MFASRLTSLCTVVSILASAAIAVGATGPDKYGYTAAAIPVAFEDLTEPTYDPTAIFDGDDDNVLTVPLPFTFVFYGVAYNSVAITTNGTLTFGGEDDDWVPVDLTKAAPTDDYAMVAPLWHDWTFEYFGSDAVYYQTLGQPGGRRFVVQWSQAISSVGPGSDTVNFEVKLYEGSNNIEFHYDDTLISDDATNSNGKGSTIGIRDVAGQTTGRVLQWSYNTASVQNDYAIRITSPVFKVTSVSRLSNKHIFMNCLGAPSSVNRIEAKTDLDSTTTDFTLLGTSAADSTGKFTFEDAAATTFTHRFYRVGMPQ